MNQLDTLKEFLKNAVLNALPQVVYLVFSDRHVPGGDPDFDGLELIGVFTTREQAENFEQSWMKNEGLPKTTPDFIRICERAVVVQSSAAELFENIQICFDAWTYNQHCDHDYPGAPSVPYKGDVSAM